MQSRSLLLLLLPSFSVVLTRELLCGGSPEPCANGGTCLRLPQGQGTCQCAPGFLGETCQFPDPCRDTQLCKNGGSCQALLPTPPSSPSPASPLTPSFSCTCPSGFTGERCQIHLEDLCPPSFCFNGGHCYVQASGRPRCSCEPGWTGKHPGRQSSGCRDKHQAEASEGFVLVQPCQLRIMVGEPCGGNRREAGRPCFMSVALVNT